MKVLTVLVDDLHAADAAVRALGDERPAAAFSRRGRRAVLVAVRRSWSCVVAWRCWRDVFRRTALDLSGGRRSTACPPTSPTRSPPAKWSSGRRRSSRSWSRTRSTPARAASTIHVELGGKKQIRVEDDGEGMEPDDARLAIERHATSKIRRADDLAAIATLGFRGEALPSIASVSHFLLRTRARGATSGTEIRVNGGAVASVDGGRRRRGHGRRGRRPVLQPAGAAQVPEVRRAPSRRRSRASSRSWRSAYPEVGFTLTSAGAQGAAVPAGRVAARPAVSAVRRAQTI